MFNKVAQFYMIANQHRGIIPQFSKNSVRELHKILLNEELNEFCNAFAKKDIVNISLSLANMCYIIAGTCVSYGICPKYEKFESPYDQPGWVHKQTTIFYNLKLDRVVQEDFKRYLTAEEQDDLESVRTCLMTMITSIFGLGFHLGVPLNSIFEEVHKSNMSKADENGNPIFREDGKVLKGKNYFPPDIKSILIKAGFDLS